jgi:hypothetical protein
MAIQIKIIGLLGLITVLALATCVSTSVTAVGVSSAEACRNTSGGKKAYKWAMATAVTGGLVSGACLAGIILLMVATK